ncbi:MAG: HAD-IA family hydrolase [Chitinivibrionales bacterium]|nr:HAD-IA family hydrolase [Chitinivibrionales bacterium]
MAFAISIKEITVLTTMKKYHYYLFDADGTIIDTRELIYQCFMYTGKKFAGAAVPRGLVDRHIGIPLRNQMEIYFGPMDDERFQEISQEHMNYQLKIYPDYLRVFPGVSDTLGRLCDAGKKLAVVTSRRSHTLGFFLQETGLHGFFSALVTPESTKRHKPDPEPAFKALSLIGGVAERSLFIGDSTYDIECGTRAGMDTAYIAWNEQTPEFGTCNPTFFLEQFEQLLPKKT